MFNNTPIGFLDTGVGGLTVIREALKQLPNETFLYIGDTERCPYGPRPVEQIKEFTWDMVNFLLKKEVKMIVIACNTATAVVLEEIRTKLTIPVVGVIYPGARAAIKSTRNNRIGVIGTIGTINSEQYKVAIQSKSLRSEVFGLACPKFVPIVESMEYHSEIARRVVHETLAPLKEKQVDTLILGCTHYPLLRKFIQDEMGKEVILIDSGAETVSEVSMLLDYYDIAAQPTLEVKKHHFFMTGSKAIFEKILNDWLEVNSYDIHRVSITGGK
ncbi:glutamate racemase [Vagococcus sp.]|uniref:glutamate racemase n=1 Tax=Vagococcus sp. TaxID=1933889 RepID=UPI003F97E99B